MEKEWHLSSSQGGYSLLSQTFGKTPMPLHDKTIKGKTLYDDFVRKIANRFDEALSRIEAEHNFEFGDEFEVALCRTLRLVLPHRFGICRGFVINAAGEAAGDDVIIYERIRFPTARFLNEDYSLQERVPIEAVFAYIEAKHTLQIGGEGDSSLQHAISQAARVKALCSQRAVVPVSQVTPHVALGAGFDIPVRHGWPRIRNPMYTAVISRRVRIQKDSKITEDPVEINSALIGVEAEIQYFPDITVAGRFNIALPVIEVNPEERSIISPFFVEESAGFATCIAVDGIAFGIALAHLLWALDYIELGPMPWSRILGESLDLPLTSANDEQV